MTVRPGPRDAVVESLATDAEVFGCVEEYRAAYGALCAYETIREQGGEVGAQAHLDAAQAVLDARTRLYRCLIGHGWAPPAAVLADLILDEAVAEEGTGAVGG
jgi:hypothetical protein